MKPKFFQEPSSRWKPGRSEPIATIRLSPKALERALNLKFEEEEDDLDRYQVAVLKTPDGGQFALFRYLQSPSGGTEIWTRSSSKEKQSELRRALEALGLSSESVFWTHPELSKQSLRSSSKLRLVGKSGRVGRNPATGERITIPARRTRSLDTKETAFRRGGQKRQGPSAKKK